MDEAELAKPVTGREITDLLFLTLLETVATLEPNATKADIVLEDMAGKLLTISGKIGEPRLSLLVRTVAENLIQTESGTGDYHL